MSFLGFLGKTLIGGVTGFLTGGPAGAIVGGLSGALGVRTAGSAGGGVQPASPLGVTGRPLSGFGRTMLTAPGPGYGGAGGGSVPSTAVTAQAAGKIECARGAHFNKSHYFTGGSHLVHPGPVVEVNPGTKCVKRRKMQVTNAHALRRALRRAYGFEKLAMRTIHLVHPKKRVRFGGFKRSRSRR